MKVKDFDYFVVGAGIPGMVAANYAQVTHPDASVALIDTASSPGGLYASQYLPEIETWVDLGMHVYYESGVDEFDSFVRGAIPEAQWMTLSGNAKDVAGIFWNGVLQKDHPYPDIRAWPLIDRARIMFDVILRAVLEGFSRSTPISALRYSLEKFGNRVTEEIIEPILLKLYSSHSSDLSIVAMKTPELGRIAIVGRTFARILSIFPMLKSRITYPDQFRMPLKRSRKQSGYYPRELGFGHQVLVPLAGQLMDKGVKVSFNSKITNIERVDDQFQINVESDTGSDQFRAKKVLWCAPLVHLSSALRLEPPKQQILTNQRKKMFISVLLSGTNHTSPLYYFYVYDPGFSIFRVTNYESYSMGSTLAKGQFILGVEFWCDESMTQAEIMSKTQEELGQLGLIDSDTCILEKMWILNVRGPAAEPTIETEKLFQDAIDKIRASHKNSDLLISGPFVKPGVFFLQDVLRDLKVECDRVLE